MASLSQALRCSGMANKVYTSIDEILRKATSFRCPVLVGQANSCQDDVLSSKNCHQRAEIKHFRDLVDTSEAWQHHFVRSFALLEIRWHEKRNPSYLLLIAIVWPIAAEGVLRTTWKISNPSEGVHTTSVARFSSTDIGIKWLRTMVSHQNFIVVTFFMDVSNI